jgi:hypothetical protein
MKVPANVSGDKLILDYLSRLTEAGLRYLPKGDRMAFVGRTRARIEREVGPAGSADPARVRQMLARLGEPEALVRAERARIDAEWRRRRGAGPPAGRPAEPGAAGQRPAAPHAAAPRAARPGGPHLNRPAGGGAGGAPPAAAGPRGAETTSGHPGTARPGTARPGTERPAGSTRSPPGASGRPASPGQTAAPAPPASPGKPAAPASPPGPPMSPVTPSIVPGLADAPGPPPAAAAGAGRPEGPPAGPAGPSGPGGPAGRRPLPGDLLEAFVRRAGVVGRAHVLESTALTLYVLGGLLFGFPVPGWLAGGLVALVSRVWDRRDKLVALIGPPVCAALLTVAVAAIARGHGNAVAVYGHVFWVGAGYTFRAGCLICAGYLGWRVHRGPRPKVPPWRR